jgi:hypothetical protein
MHCVPGRNILVADHRLYQMLGGRLTGTGGFDFLLAQTEARREHRKKAVTADGIGHHIGQGDQCANAR